MTTKQWSRQKTLNLEMNPETLSTQSIIQQISSLNQQIQHLKCQISIVELNLLRICQFSQEMHSKFSLPNHVKPSGLEQRLNVQELNIKVQAIESRLRQSAQREQFIMLDIEKISNRVLNVESTLQAQFDHDSCNMGEIPSVSCSQSHCQAKFNAPYEKIYHRKHAHHRLKDA